MPTPQLLSIVPSPRIDDLTAQADSSPQRGDEAIVIESRYGRLSIDPRSVVDFAGGLLGFSRKRKFALLEPGDERYEDFRLLQSVEEPDLSFIVLPLATKNDLIAPADIKAACTALGFDLDNTVVLLLVTARRENESVALSVNLRAPLLIDAGRFAGAQYVLANERYAVRHLLNG